MALSLVKGQKISLAKESGGSLTSITMGLGWDAVQQQPKKGLLSSLFGSSSKETSIDLDASCAMLDDSKKIIDVVWFGQLKSKDGSIVHTGDNLTGEGDGDDEQIVVDLSKVPAKVKFLVFTVCSFRGQTFSAVENAFCRLVDNSTNGEIARYTLSGGGDFTAMIMAKVYRHENGWKMHAVGESANGRTIEDLMPGIIASL